jgi:hypothetical protein
MIFETRFFVKGEPVVFFSVAQKNRQPQSLADDFVLKAVILISGPARIGCDYDGWETQVIKNGGGLLNGLKRFLEKR